MDEIKLGIAQHKGLRAKELLDNSLLNEAFAAIEERYLSEWRSSKVADQEAREAAWRALKTLDGIKDLLKIYVRDGKVAASDLHRLSEEAKRKNARRI